jgi:GT2 family glycosyltransferase
MLLSIIIVNYNTQDLTMACCESIVRYLGKTISFEVIIVDNDSNDGSREALRKFTAGRDNVHVIESDTNVGFAKGNNVGIRKATGKQVLLLNSDTYLIDDSITQAVAFLEARRNVFGCGCTLLNADGSAGISYGKFPELGVVFCEIATWRYAHLRAMVPRRPKDVFTIDFPCGAFFLIKRELLDKIGMLDEQFFMYSEETDLAKRAKKAGYRIMHFGPTRVVHLRGGSNPKDGKAGLQNAGLRDLNVLFYQSWRRYLKKHCSTLDVVLIGMLLSLFFKMNYLIFYFMRNERARAQYAKELQAFRVGWKTEAAQ